MEGLIDIQVKPRADVNLHDLEGMKKALADTYPVTKDLKFVTAHVNFEKESAESIASEQVGYRLEKRGAPFVLLVRRDGLTVSRLRPYTKWEDLIEEARPAWRLYREFCKPDSISRIATRFINRLQFPADNLDFDDYLAAPPRIPKGLPESLLEFFVRLVVPDESGAEIAIIQSLNGIDLEARLVHMLLDIDVYKVVDFEPASENIWQLLDIMRRLKNCAFFGAVTDKTLELLK